MKTRIFLTISLLMISLSALSAPQSTVFGTWTFSSISTPSGKHFCSIFNAVTSRNIGQNIVIKGDPKTKMIRIDLYKDAWNRPQGETVQVMFDFLDNQPLALPAYADAHILDIELPTQILAIFLLQLAQQPALQVIFPDGSDDTWIVENKGAQKAIKAFFSCLKQK